MGDNAALTSAKKAKQDEFYTQYADIQTEMNAYLEYDPDVFRVKTEEAKVKGISNCPDCALAHDANAKCIYAFSEMEADHVTAWSKGGDTSEANCQMLCRHHNRAKGTANGALQPETDDASPLRYCIRG